MDDQTDRGIVIASAKRTGADHDLVIPAVAPAIVDAVFELVRQL
jgi:hypothetical protein